MNDAKAANLPFQMKMDMAGMKLISSVSFIDIQARFVNNLVLKAVSLHRPPGEDNRNHSPVLNHMFSLIDNQQKLINSTATDFTHFRPKSDAHHDLKGFVSQLTDRVSKRETEIMALSRRVTEILDFFEGSNTPAPINQRSLLVVKSRRASLSEFVASSGRLSKEAVRSIQFWNPREWEQKQNLGLNMGTGDLERASGEHVVDGHKAASF